MQKAKNIKVFKGVKEHLGIGSPLLQFVTQEIEKILLESNFKKCYTSLIQDVLIYKESLGKVYNGL
jgi:uncharacterized protein YihD (DUF1040 family)